MWILTTSKESTCCHNQRSAREEEPTGAPSWDLFLPSGGLEMCDGGGVCVMLATARSKNLNMLRSTRACLCESHGSAMWVIHPVCASTLQCLFHWQGSLLGAAVESIQLLTPKRMAGHPSSWLRRDCRDRIARQGCPFIKKLFYLTPHFVPSKVIPLHKKIGVWHLAQRWSQIVVT